MGAREDTGMSVWGDIRRKFAIGANTVREIRGIALTIVQAGISRMPGA